jgi:hypothetical protein
MSRALSADEAMFTMARRPLWVKSAVLTTGRPPPVSPITGCSQTSADCLKGANGGQYHSTVIGRQERREQHATAVVARVPEFTAIADIKLNERHPLRRCKKTG